MRVCIAGLVLGAAALVASGDTAVDDRLVFEVTPEAPDAQKLGAPEVTRAQKLAKAKQFGDAAIALEALAKKLPASVHDCNLALAYLRAGLLTRAQLAWDLSGLRNGARPKWCTGEVSTQLSQALRAGRYVPTALEIAPSEALVEVGGALLRNMRTVWLPSGTTTITASAPGKVTQTVTVTIAPPSGRVAITLEAPPPPAQPDAGVAEPMANTDAALPPVVTPDAGTPAVTPVEEDALIHVGGTPVGYRVAALTVALAGWVTTGVLGVQTYRAKERANEHYTSDPEFGAQHDLYQNSAYLTLGTAAVSAIATGVYVYFLTRGDAVIRKPGRIQVGGRGDGSFGISYSGTFGGAGP